MSLFMATALLTSSGKVMIEHGAIDISIPTQNEANIANTVCASIALIRKLSII